MECGRLVGANFSVEVDEAKLGKHKFNRERVVDGQSVFGGICRKTECFFVPVQGRTQETLFSPVKKHVAPGTIIYSYCFKSYECLEQEGFRHLTVSHKENFVDPHTGTLNQYNGIYLVGSGSLRSSHTQKQHFAAYRRNIFDTGRTPMLVCMLPEFQ
ncbi:uncharacterized protein LOC106011202 [Aplysia californica]|uniref:Uncharacterized protein LOC106011202 n=1 Tax=Aplysia californica TaxID=6500 RepID=A0ABM0ZVL3_APLCA|nr:uncharacterized protein LOC106011202 [Aplysia californica]